MILIDGRVVLRAIEKKDNEVLKALANDPEVEDKIAGWSFPISDERQEKWFEMVSNYTSKEHVRFAIEYEGKCVGMAALSSIDYKNSHADIDIKLVADVRGKGIGSKTIEMLKKYAFEELNLNMLISEVIEDNEASKGMFEKAGFSLDGILRKRIYKSGRYRAQCIYSILKSEYKGCN